jgi:CheY-like chemotaxis protein
MLQHLGFDVDVVSDGTEAVRAAIQRPYRAILMDCQIPGLDGYQATGKIRRQEEPSRRASAASVCCWAMPSRTRRNCAHEPGAPPSPSQ